MDTKPNIYQIHGRFLVFKKEDALNLRKKRILGQLVGCSPINPHQVNESGLPYLISHYATKVAFENNIACFKRLITRDRECLHHKALLYNDWLSEKIEESRVDYEKKKTQEMEKRNVVVTPDRLKGFDEAKIKITIPEKPEEKWSSMASVDMSETEVMSQLIIEDDRMLTFRELYGKGLYISCGLKFGCDFLAYVGDPVRYHAEYALRIVPYHEDGNVDLSRIDYNEVNALNRLCHNSNKIPLLVTKVGDKLKYWAPQDKHYLASDSATGNLPLFNTDDMVVETSLWQHGVSSLESHLDEEAESKMRKVI